MNSATLQGKINEVHKSSDILAIQKSGLEGVKILGLNWDYEADGFYD